MKLEVLHSLPELTSIAEEWNQLLTNSASHVPFLRHEYIITWWKTLGGGEWHRGELYVVTGRTEEGQLCGIAPLFFTENLDGQPALMLIGSIEISDFLDLLVRPKHLEPFIEALFNHFASPQAPDWNVLDWYNLLESSPTLPVIEKLATKKGWEFTQEQIKPAPYIKLPTDWETYLAGIQSKQRHEIRRKMRKAAGYFLPVRWYIVEDETTLNYEIDAFLRLMAYDQEKEAFLTEAMRGQMRAAIQAAFRNGWLQLTFLEVGDEKAAAYLNFDYDNQIWVYNSGINYEYNTLSPGWVLLGYLIQWAIENGRDALDFMRGDEDYKYRFGGINRYVMRARVER